MKSLNLAALLVAGLGVAACTSSNMANMSFSVTTRSAAPLASAPFATGTMMSVTASGDSTVIALDTDTVVVRSVDIVLRKVELKRSDVSACDSIEGNGDCEDFETGATLVSLPLGSTAVAQQVAVSAPAGSYDGFEFDIHVPGDDTAFVNAHPDFATISIRVTGTFIHNSTRSDFTFTSTLDQGMEGVLSPPITVQDGQSVNVTLRADISGWFLNETKTALVDPASANVGQPNQSIVENNIKNSFKAFEDDNRDGIEG